MNRRNTLLLLGAGLLATPAQAATSSLRLFSRRTPRRPLLIAGSTAMDDLCAALGFAFEQAHPDVDVVTEEGGSLSAFIALTRGSIDVAAMTRDLHDDEDVKGVRSYLVARTGVEVIASRESGITSITSEQAGKILSGEIDNWSLIGMKSAPLQVIVGAPSRRIIEEEVLASGAIRRSSRAFRLPEVAAQAVAGDPQSIGFVIHGTKLDDDVQRLSVDGIDASRETLLSDRYPFTTSMYFVVRDDAQSTGTMFIDFVRGSEGAQIIEQQKLIATS